MLCLQKWVKVKQSVIEYSRGESPYGETLKKYKSEKLKTKKITKEKLVYNGPMSYSYAYNDEIVHDFNRQIEYSNYISDISSTVYRITSSLTILGGMWDTSSTIGCSPAAGTNIVSYWANTYSSLTRV